MSARTEARNATRASVLASSLRLFTQRGFAATTIKDIAADAGVSVGTVMSVGDKSSLLVAGIDARIEELHRTRSSEAHVHSSPQDGAAEALVAVLSPFIDMLTSDPGLSRSYGAILVSGTHRARAFGELREILLGELREAIVQTTSCSPRAAEERATTAYLVYLGALLEWASTPDADKQMLLDRVRDAVRPLVITSERKNNP